MTGGYHSYFQGMEMSCRGTLGRSWGLGGWDGVARGRVCSLVELLFGILGSFQPSSQG